MADQGRGVADRARLWLADTPANLAVFRITVGVVFLLLPDIADAARWAALPPEVRVAPIGVGWALDFVPITPELANAAYRVLVAALLAGIAGVFTRAAWTVATVAAIYLLGLPQLGGAAFHYHHLVWFSALLAASPCGDAISVDALLARRRGDAPPPGRDIAYGAPLRVAWTLIGFIFFFPGMWKVATSGWEWIWSDNLRNQMYAKWLQKPEFTPIFRVDRWPTLVRLGAFCVVAFELSFAFLVPFRRTRPWAVAAAIAFHQITAYFMSLAFSALWLCYVVFFDWSAIAARVRGTTAEPAVAERSPTRPWRATVVVGAILVTGNLAFGIAGINDGWPFACYPKFDRTVGERLPAMEVDLVRADGSTQAVPIAWMSPDGRSQRWWALSWSLLGAHERARASPERFRAFWESVTAASPRARAATRASTQVRFYRAYVSTIPEARDDPPLSRRLVYALPLASNPTDSAGPPP